MLNLNSVFESGGYKDNGVKYYNGEFKDRHRIFPGDLIITNTEQGHEHRLIGFGAIVPKNIEDSGIFSQHIYRVTSKGNILSTNYLYYLLKEADMREQMIGGTNGSTVNMLPIESIENAKTVMPSESKLLKFDAIAKDVQSKKESNQTQIMQLKSLQDSLLSKFMNVTIKVNNLVDDTHS
jgi:type I restriction enzyme S subunit